MKKISESLAIILRAFEISLNRDMPESPYQKFHLWALSPENPQHKTWWQIIGIPQFVMLTTTLLDNLVSQDQWPQLLEYTAAMNTYLIYETISDNLAMGIQSPSALPHIKIWQTEVLQRFNQAMIARLSGTTIPTAHTLAGIQPTTQSLSYFDFSLTHDELATFTCNFIHQCGEDWHDDIEFGTWNALVANIESCFQASALMDETPLGEMVRCGFIERYEAVNTLLTKQELSLPQLMAVSSRAILVMPVLAYYIAALTETNGTSDKLAPLVSNDVLLNTLYDAAMLVRLTNDLGTELVTQRRSHQVLLNELSTQAEELELESIPLGDLLLGMVGDMPFLTRINKDLLHGEFNLLLHDLTHLPCNAQTIRQIEFKLSYFQRQYSEGRSRLLRNLKVISETMQDDRVSTMILRFVEFHEQLYNHPFDAQVGDYATKPKLSILPVEN